MRKLADDAELFCKRRIYQMALFLTQGHLCVTAGTPDHRCKVDECSSKSSRCNDNVASISSGSAPWNKYAVADCLLITFSLLQAARRVLPLHRRPYSIMDLYISPYLYSTPPRSSSYGEYKIWSREMT